MTAKVRAIKWLNENYKKNYDFSLNLSNLMESIIVTESSAVCRLGHLQ